MKWTQFLILLKVGKEFKIVSQERRYYFYGGKHLNPNMKLEVLNKYLDNMDSLDTLSREYNIPRSTIYKWVKPTRDGKDISIRKKESGRAKEENIKSDLLKRNFKTDSLNKVWDTDVTYLIFKDKRLYLST